MISERSVLRSKVNIKGLKAFALGLPTDSRLRDLILTEDDELDVNEFLAKMDLWLRLVRMESS